jgi:archaellum component FlaF (FlaF/FlaG flagellin family)
MFFLVAVAIVLASFLVIFGLWFVIWSLTMGSSDMAKTLVKDRVSNLR